MLQSYFKVAIRHLLRNKSYVLLNTLGMGIALTCCITAYLLVAYNLEFDAYFAEDQTKRVVKVVHHLQQPDGETYRQLTAPVVLAPLAAREIAGIRSFTRYCSDGAYLRYGNNTFAQTVYFADSAFFDLFRLGLKSGAYRNFRSRNAIFLGENLARKYFGNADPVGETVQVQLGNRVLPVLVGGVLAELPLNSSFTHDALMRIEPYLDTYAIRPDDWRESRDASVLFTLDDPAQRERIAGQLGRYLPLRNAAKTDAKSTAFELVPFLAPFSPNEVRQSYLHLRIPFKALVIFMTLGLLILLIACFNLTNTTLALTARRLKEIGVRKVVGSGQGQIVIQFLLEMALTIALAVVAGLLMAQLVVPEFAAMWGLRYGLGDLSGTNLLVTLVLLLFASALLAGLYPALLNSRLGPVVLLKGGFRSKGTSPLTRVLLVGQFSLSVIVLIAGVVFVQNAGYQQRVNFGYDYKKAITVSIQGAQDYERLKNALATHPNISNVAVAHNHLGLLNSFPGTIRLGGRELQSNVYEVGAGYFDAMGLPLVAGRDFRENSQSDDQGAVIVDRNFVRNHHLTRPLGTSISYQGQSYLVVGVVENHLSSFFDKGSLHKDHLYRVVRPEQYRVLVARTGGGSVAQTQLDIARQWKALFPGRPLSSDLQEDIVFRGANEYNRNLKRVFLFLTVLGCLLSASGIYSLATLNVQRRTREIGVRKVHGASTTQIFGLLNREFAILLGVAAVLGGAGGFSLTNALLDDLYVHHVSVGLVPVLLSGLLVFGLGILAAGVSILRAARANPLESLKAE
jgi:ABC-type antimicrobial peptide transport system permease subunit